MAFIVEDGTGQVAANSLASIDFFTDYCNDYGYSVQSGWEDDRKQSALIKATSYLDTFYGTRFDGLPLNREQSLCWPRRNATRLLNSEGHRQTIAPDAIPVKIQQAVCELAIIADTADLSPNIEPSDLNTISEKVGPIEVKYNSKTTLGVTLFRRAALLLSSYVTSSGLNIRMTRG